MAESARGFVRAVERRRIMLSTVFALNVEEYLEDGPSSCRFEVDDFSSSVSLELADLSVDEDVE